MDGILAWIVLIAIVAGTVYSVYYIGESLYKMWHRD